MPSALTHVEGAAERERAALVQNGVGERWGVACSMGCLLCHMESGRAPEPMDRATPYRRVTWIIILRYN